VVGMHDKERVERAFHDRVRVVGPLLQEVLGVSREIDDDFL
jgi:hypothetical protein